MPIDIATGNVLQDYEDVSVPGQIPLVWERHYRSVLTKNTNGALGPGWTCRYLAALTRHPGGFEFMTPTGAIELLPDSNRIVESGGIVRRPEAFLEVLVDKDRYVVQAWSPESAEIWRYCFALGEVQQGRALSMTSIENPAGQAADLTWEGGRLQSVRQRFERRELHLTYNPTGEIEGVSLATADGETFPVCSYEYDLAGRLIRASDAAGIADRFEYDGNNRLVREIVKDGGVFHYRYDASGRCILRTGLGHYDEKRLKFLDAIGIVEVSDSYGTTSRYQCLSNGQVDTEWTPMGGRKQMVYDRYGRISTRTDATGGITSYEYDEAGNCSAVIDALGAVTSCTYNDRHQPLTKIEALGQCWQREYDDHYFQIAAIDPLNHRWRFQYDSNGNLSETVDPVGSTERRRYDESTLEVIDAMGQASRFEFDAFGRVLSCKSPTGDLTRIRYDAIGNPIQITLPNGAEMLAVYDHAGNLVRYVDANRHTTAWRFGPCGRLLERVDPLGNHLRFVWGSEPGRLQEVVNENDESHRFLYDDAGRVAVEVMFDGSERQFSYDAEDYLASQTNGAGQAIAFNRDAMHRVISQILPDAKTTRFSFDLCGRLVEAVSDSAVVRFERDALGRICRENQDEDWVRTRYDAAGNVVQTCTSLGHQADFDLNATGAPISLKVDGGETFLFERDTVGRETVRVMPGGARLTQRYDSRGQLIEQQMPAVERTSNGSWNASAHEDLVQRRYAYDGSGLLTSISDSRWGNTNCAYDPAQQLIQTLRDRNGLCERFEYDAPGNLTRIQTEGGDGVAQDVSLLYSRGNRLVRSGQTHYEHDGQGRLVRKIEERHGDVPKVWTYSWDALDHLVAATLPNQHTWHYKYDAFGRRVGKSCSSDLGASRRFLWNQNVLVHEADTKGNVSTWLFDSDTFAPLVTIQNEQVYGVVTNHLGTPCELIDQRNRVAWVSRRSAWGRNEASAHNDAGAECKISFAGQWEDDESGLNYNWHRYYDPDVGRYISPDPLLLGGGQNFYRYCSNNPFFYIDPLGLVCWSTARKEYWKKEATNNPGKYSPNNVQRMNDGKAPKMTVTVINNKTGVVSQVDVSMELHHTNIPQRVGGPTVHNASNLTPLTPWQHEAADPYRHTGSTPVSVDKGVGSW